MTRARRIKVVTVVDELHDYLARLNDPDVTWGFAMGTYLPPADAGDRTAESISSSTAGAADAPLAP